MTTTVIFAALVGAIAWNVIAWYFGLPSSSSHALIGGLVGAVIAAQGFAAVNGDGLFSNLIVPAIIAPARLRSWSRDWRFCSSTGSSVSSRLVLSGTAFVSVNSLPAGCYRSHTARTMPQKTMGVIALALVAHGDIAANAFYVPDWVVVASASAIALGTFVGGWRIIKTLGSRIIEMDVAQGFAAQAAGATVILAASGAGYPLSTTHVIL